jgi:hypothetical protein
MGILRLLLAIAVVMTHCGSVFGFSLVNGRIAECKPFILFRAFI